MPVGTSKILLVVTPGVLLSGVRVEVAADVVLDGARVVVTGGKGSGIADSAAITANPTISATIFPSDVSPWPSSPWRISKNVT